MRQLTFEETQSVTGGYLYGEHDPTLWSPFENPATMPNSPAHLINVIEILEPIDVKF